jgi:hypothetical protein
MYHATAVEEKFLKEKIIWLQEMRFWNQSPT